MALEEYSFIIKYQKGKNNKADALTRRNQDIPQQEDNTDMVVLAPHRYIEVNEITIEQPEDPLAKELGELLQYKGNLIMVPDDQKL